MPQAEMKKFISMSKESKAAKILRLTRYYAPMDEVDGDHIGLITRDAIYDLAATITPEEFDKFSYDMLCDALNFVFGMKVVVVKVYENKRI